MAIDHKDVLPAIIIEINKCISPTDVTLCGSCDARRYRDVRKHHVSVIPIESCILDVEMRNQNRHAPGMQIIAQRNAHVGLPCAVFAQPDSGGKAHIFK